MEPREQLRRIARIQELANAMRAGQEIVDRAPALLEQIEQRFRERNAEYVAIKERHDAVEADRRTRSGELSLLEEQRKKYMVDLMQVSNQREYAAILREIDSVKARLADHEEAILKDMEDLETLVRELESHEAHIQQERQRVEQERRDVETQADQTRRAILEQRAERERIEGELPNPLVESIRRVEASRQGVFLSRAEDGVCQCCFVRIRPQVYQEIRLASGLHSCENCRRILYHQRSLTESAPATEPERDASGGSSGVEALNGGAV